MSMTFERGPLHGPADKPGGGGQENIKENKSARVVEAVIDMMLKKDDFSRAYSTIDDDVRAEMSETLAGKVQGILDDSSVPAELKADTVASKIVDDISDRRGIRQEVFDGLFFDDEAVKKYIAEHPEDASRVTENDSRSGIRRQIAAVVRSVIEQ